MRLTYENTASLLPSMRTGRPQIAITTCDGACAAAAALGRPGAPATPAASPAPIFNNARRVNMSILHRREPACRTRVFELGSLRRWRFLDRACRGGGIAGENLFVPPRGRARSGEGGEGTGMSSNRRGQTAAGSVERRVPPFFG